MKYCILKFEYLCTISYLALFEQTDVISGDVDASLDDNKNDDDIGSAVRDSDSWQLDATLIRPAQTTIRCIDATIALRFHRRIRMSMGRG